MNKDWPVLFVQEHLHDSWGQWAISLKNFGLCTPERLTDLMIHHSSFHIILTFSFKQPDLALPVDLVKLIKSNISFLRPNINKCNRSFLDVFLKFKENAFKYSRLPLFDEVQLKIYWFSFRSTLYVIHLLDEEARWVEIFLSLICKVDAEHVSCYTETMFSVIL